jgi:hypothetical protein
LPSQFPHQRFQHDTERNRQSGNPAEACLFERGQRKITVLAAEPQIDLALTRALQNGCH